MKHADGTVASSSSSKPELWNDVVDNNVMAEISARLSVSSLRSLSVHFDPRSLQGLTTLVAVFLNSTTCM